MVLRTTLLVSLTLVSSCLGQSCTESRPAPTGVESPSSPTAKPASSGAAPGTPDRYNIELARQRDHKQLFEWQPWSKEVFERARAEGRYILLHCAAVWCHWCHVMEETTYLDPEIGRILRDRFVTIRVDVDSRPDIQERYEDWGWPATVLFTPQAEEIGKYRGYRSPDELRDILAAVEDQALARSDHDARDPGPSSAQVSALPWVAEAATHDMDDYYDDDQGSWGARQKVPIGANAEFEVRRAAHGDAAARKRAAFTLDRHARVDDPVWGGVYQYSTDGVWENPHFEKLMPVQTSNLEAFARGYQVLGDRALLGHAERIASYVARFMTSPEGTFYVSQDADVGTHDKTQKFVDGNVYYREDEKGRLALGVPWVDEHVYGYENGLMIAALVALHEASGDDRYLATARRAADALIASHVEESGAVRHDAGSASRVRFLADAAGLGRGLARLARVTGEDRYRRAALRIAGWSVAQLSDGQTGALWAHTTDPNAAGVFTRRRRPLSQNVLAARFFAELARLEGGAGPWLERSRAVLAAISTPAALDAQGRMLGEYLLALDEAGVYPWR